MSRDLKLFIEQVINKELEEEAIPSSAASSRGLALYVMEDGGVTAITLYDPGLYDSSYQTEEMVMGLIEIEKVFKCHSWRILASSAEKGYGPLMYDIAFATAGAEGLVSDRSQVSDSARKVWQYNFTKRKDDFEIVPVESQCKFNGRGHEEALNYKYIAKHPINLDQLIGNHDRFLNSLRSNEQKDLLLSLRDQSNKFFTKKYWGVR